MDEKNNRWKYAIVVTIVLSVFIINTARSIYHNRKSLSRLDQAQSELDELILTNDQLKNDINYTQSEEFLEKEAFEKLGMTKPGYTVVVVDQSPTTDEQKTLEARSKEEAEKPIILWLKLFNLK